MSVAQDLSHRQHPFEKPAKRTADDTTMDTEPIQLVDYIPPVVKRRKKSMSTMTHYPTATPWTAAPKRSNADLDIDIDYEPKRRKLDCPSEVEPDRDTLTQAQSVVGNAMGAVHKGTGEEYVPECV